MLYSIIYKKQWYFEGGKGKTDNSPSHANKKPPTRIQ
jgi:hypothetical protein